MMNNFDKAIKIIMAEPPEPRYPSYYADLLREADVPDKDDGKCSEIPNSSDLISKQQAIDALRTCYDTETISMDNGDEYINYGDAVGGIEQLSSAQPETSILTVTVGPDSEEIERVVRKIKDAPVMVLPSVKPETCEGCKHLGKWENEVEYGFNSPCTCCKRRVADNYER